MTQRIITTEERKQRKHRAVKIEDVEPQRGGQGPHQKGGGGGEQGPQQKAVERSEADNEEEKEKTGDEKEEREMR